MHLVNVRGEGWWYIYSQVACLLYAQSPLVAVLRMWEQTCVDVQFLCTLIRELSHASVSSSV